MVNHFDHDHEPDAPDDASYPAMLDERCHGCDDPNVYAYRRNEMTGRCYDPTSGAEIFTCPRCGYDLTPHLADDYEAHSLLEDDC